MPRSKNSKRWKLPKEIILRKGQQLAIESIEQSPNKSDYVFVLPTGYGKSFISLLSYQTARSQGRCNRLLIVVATGVQREQYARDLEKDARTLGIELLGDRYLARECNGDAFVIKASLQNQCEVFITTVQGMNPKGMGFYFDLMSKGKWMIIADEAHHYSDCNVWGKAVNSLPANVRVALTATPSRTDNKDLVVGGGLEYDVEISVKEAIKEGALRPFRIERGDYEVDLSIDGETKSLSLSELEDEFRASGCTTISEWEIKRQCRYHTKYIQGIFSTAINIYDHLELLYPSKNQILVFAWSCEHAKQIAAQINNMAGHSNFADWIGTSGRTDEENRLVLSRFMAPTNFLPCLVQVNKASEGFNNPRCSIGVFLNAINPDTPTLLQQLGRLMRTLKDGSPNAVVLVGKDHPLSYTDLSELGELTRDFREAQDIAGLDNVVDTNKDKRYQIYIPPLGDVFIDIKRLIGFDSVYPFNDSPESIAEKLVQSGKYTDIDKSVLLKNILELQKEVKPEDLATEQTYSQQRDNTRRQVASAVNQLVNKAMFQTLYPQKPSGSIRKDWYRKTNQYLGHRFGFAGSLSIEDLKTKYEFVVGVANQINETQEVPSWMIP